MKKDNIELDKVMNIVTGSEVENTVQRKTLGMVWKDGKLQPQYVSGAPDEDQGSYDKLKKIAEQKQIDALSDLVQGRSPVETGKIKI